MTGEYNYDSRSQKEAKEEIPYYDTREDNVPSMSGFGTIDIARVRSNLSPQIFRNSMIAGGLTLGAGLAIQALYKVTNIYPPQAVFFFAIGMLAHVASDATGLSRQYCLENPVE